MVHNQLPPLRQLAPDLLAVTRRQRLTAVALPFACCAAYWAFADSGWWWPAVASLVALSFFTYPSTSHDLVHRSLGMPVRANEWLLALTELLAVRSGHAYRASHLHHHARFPAEDDVEGAAAGMTWPRAILDGLTLQYRSWIQAWRLGKDRGWIAAEVAACLGLMLGAAVSAFWMPLLAVYVGLMVAGGWLIPLATSYIPHDADAASELFQTRAYRGRVASAAALGHLYHLEHHLYPAVPHHHWPELARRLDPHLARAGVKPKTLWF